MSKATTARFASAFGLPPDKKAAGARADDGDKKETDEEKKTRRAKDRAKKDGETDEDYAKRCAELDDKEKAEDDKEKKDAAAPAAQTPADEPKDDKQSAQARAEGTAAERKRWEMTLSDPRCTNKGLTACNLLATSNLSTESILAVLDTVPESVTAAEAPKQPGLAARMAAETIVPPTPAAPAPSGAAAQAAEIMKAAELARGGKF